MNQVLEKNLKCLEKNQPQVFKKVAAYINKEYIPKSKNVEKILLARQDELILNMLVVCNGTEYLLCDHEDPINQAYEWIDKYIDPTSSTYIVFGMGFGYHLEVLITSFKNKKVIIIEPDIDLFYHILSVRNLDTIIEQSTIFLDEDSEYIIHSLSGLFLETGEGGTQFQPFEIYTEMFFRQWEDIRDRFIKRVESFAVDVATRRYFGELFIYNNITNAHRLHKSSNAGALTGKFRNKPAILVSAGPSLDKSIPLLKLLQDKCILIAAGTAVNILEQYDIKPHFMMGIDAGKEEADIHENVKNKDIFFLYSNQVATGSVEKYEGPKFLMNYSADDFTKGFFERNGIESELYYSGPSVSNTCFDVLYKMGCNPIILVGQDLSLTDDREYAGTGFGKRINRSEDLKQKGFVCVKDKAGNEVFTRRDLLAIRNWFEGYFEKLQGKVEIINATERGLNIAFSRNATLTEVLEKYRFDEGHIFERIRDIHEESRFGQDIQGKMSEYVDILLESISELEEYSKKQLKLLDLVKRDVYHPSKGKNAFNRVAGQIAEFTDKVLNNHAYKILVKNIMEMDFFLIKREVDLATKNLSSYGEVKDFYTKAIEQQNKLLKTNIEKIRQLLRDNRF